VIHLTVIGDALLDRDWEGGVERITPDAPAMVFEESTRTVRPGGAALAASLAVDSGTAVTLVAAVGVEGAGAELRELLDAAGVEIVDVDPGARTAEKIRIRAGGQTLLRIDRRPATSAHLSTAAAVAALEACDGVLVADYGGAIASDLRLRPLLEDAARSRPVVWDPHPRGATPVRGVDTVTPNVREAAAFAGMATPGPHDVQEITAIAGAVLARWGSAIAVTAGELGAVLLEPAQPPHYVSTTPVRGDPCGAGDQLAASYTRERARGGSRHEALITAVADARRFVAGGAANVRPLRPVDEPALQVAERARAEGRRVVLASGCFDLLHAGHVQLLQQARRLGDHLVVAINSDASVRRLKGAHRPIVPQHDRMETLRALECVDAVMVFEEDTPAATIDRLRPHVYVKGDDYAGRPLPEQAVLSRHGVQLVLIPLKHGRSTSSLVERAASGGG
jgi:rfaE bifunctional protein nucleotidyltransferase chain/domain